MADSERLIGAIPTPEALLQIAVQLGGVQQGLKDKPSSQDVTRALNDQARDFRAAMSAMEAHVRDLLKGMSTENDQRSSALQLQIQNFVTAASDAAAERALEKQRQAEKKAREELELKERDAVKGMKRWAFSSGAIGVALTLIVIWGVKQMNLGWEIF